MSARENTELMGLLGHRPDTALAKRYGISKGYVAQLRKEAGIPAFDPDKRDAAYVESLLGTDTDENVADLAGLSVQAVRTRRAKAGIPAFGSRRYADRALAAKRPILRFRYRHPRRSAVEARQLVEPRLWHGVSPHHEGAQWFVSGYCLDRRADRDFPVVCIEGWEVP